MSDGVDIGDAVVDLVWHGDHDIEVSVPDVPESADAHRAL